MTVWKKYWITEILLGLIAMASLGIAAFNILSPSQVSGSTVTSLETTSAPAGAGIVAPQAVAPPTNENPAVVIAEEDNDDDDENPDFESDEDNTAVDGDTNDEEADDDCEEDGAHDDRDFDDDLGKEDPFDHILTQFGLDMEDVEAQLMQGRSLAEVATAAGVEVQALVTELVKIEQQQIAADIEAGEISAEEAQEAEMMIEAEITFWVNTAYLEPEIVAAQTMGIDPEILWDALDGGQTLADLAQSQGVEPQAVIDAIIVSEITYLREMVKADLVASSEIAEIEAEIQEFVTQLVTIGEIDYED